MPITRPYCVANTILAVIDTLYDQEKKRPVVCSLKWAIDSALSRMGKEEYEKHWPIFSDAFDVAQKKITSSLYVLYFTALLMERNRKELQPFLRYTDVQYDAALRSLLKVKYKLKTMREDIAGGHGAREGSKKAVSLVMAAINKRIYDGRKPIL